MGDFFTEFAPVSEKLVPIKGLEGLEIVNKRVHPYMYVNLSQW